MSELQSFSLDIQDYPVAAGGYLELGKPADFFQIMEATGPVDVTFLHSESSVGMARGVGQGFRLGPLQNRFYGVKIYSATAQTLKLCFSSGKSPVDLSQVVSVTGTVSVINGELARVLNQECFIGRAAIAGVAGQYPAGQIINPAGSGKNVFVSEMSAYTDAATSSHIQLAAYSTALATAGSAVNKKIGGSAPVGLTKSGTSATSITASAIIQNIPSKAPFEWGIFPLSEPICLVPGTGLALEGNVVAASIWTNFQWFEEPV